MNKKVREFTHVYTEVVQDCEKYTFLPRGIKYQKESIEKLSRLLSLCSKTKHEVIEEGDEEAANQMLSFSCMINALRFELKMWIDLKNEEWDKAWNSLVDAEEYAQSARSAHEIIQECSVNEYIDKLRSYQSSIFPPQQFNSPGMYVKKFTCSICGEDYSECEHIAGETYWGEFCQRIPEEIIGTREVSLVDEPADKKARMTEHLTDDNMIRDQLTWEKREMTDEEKEQYEDRSDDHMIFTGVVMTSSESNVDFSEYLPEGTRIE